MDEKSRHPGDVIDAETYTALKDLSHLVIDSLSVETKEEWLADAEYTTRLKSHLYQDFPRFQERLIKGYKSLLETLEHSEKK